MVADLLSGRKWGSTLDTVAPLCQSKRHMATVEKARSAFGEKLRTELKRRDLSIRQFSRMLDPSKPEQARRSLAKWIAPGPPNPSKGSRRLVADRLGVDPKHFDEDDDEDDPEVELIVSVLMHRIDRVVEEQVEKIAQRLGVEA